jgi:hypothetical protein
LTFDRLLFRIAVALALLNLIGFVVVLLRG